MFKITIDNQEVITDKDFTIEEEMLNTPSVILNNVYPKEWEQDKDYLNFYHPNEYSKCKIYDEEITPASEGSTVEGTDFSITYDNTKEFNLLSLKGETSQETTTGKNLLPSDLETWSNYGITITKNLDGTYKVNGTASQDISVAICNDFIAMSGTWRLVGCPSGGSASTYMLSAYVGYWGQGSPNIDTGNGTNITYTGNVKIRFYIKSGTQCNNLIFKPMITTNTSDTYNTFEPYTYGASPNPSYPQEVQTVTGRQDIWVAGKNLFDKDNEQWTSYYITGSSATTLSPSTYNRTLYISCQPNTTYTIQKMVSVSSSRFFIASSVNIPSANVNIYNVYNAGDSSTSATYTTSSNAKYLLVNYMQTNATTTTVEEMLNSIQIEKGSSATTYEAYKGTTYELNLGKNLFDKDSANVINAYISTGTKKITSNANDRVIYIKCSPNTTYTVSKIVQTPTSDNRFVIGYIDTLPALNSVLTNLTYLANGTTATNLSITTGATAQYLVCGIYHVGAGTTFDDMLSSIQIEKGSQATSYSPYKTPLELCKIGNYQDYIFKNIPDSDYYDNTLEEGAWYLHKDIGKVVLNGSESWYSASSGSDWYEYGCSNIIVGGKTGYNNCVTNYFSNKTNNRCLNNSNACLIRTPDTTITTPALFKTWLGTHNTNVYYQLATPTTELIEDSDLLGQLEEINLLNGLNNISVSSPYLTTPIKIHYNFNEEIINQDLYFCGVVKNSGNISLNPREPHFQSLQVLSYKTFLSEGETLDFVIYQKTIREAIEQVVSAISDYGFVVGNINILNPDEIIGAYSTKDKSAYDVFQYIADITQSRWTTRMIDEDTIAIDFYDPTLMQLGTAIDYTKEFFENNLIDDMSYSYGTNDYRNKQVMTSQEVYSNINQTQNIVANGYQTQFNTEQQIGKINSIEIGGVDYTFATNTEKDMGVIADFYYSAGNNYFESASTISIGTVIAIDYLPIVEGRQIIANSNEIDRVANSTGVKGVVARYENRNDATTSTELQLIGQSYIKYKGVPEIVLTVITRKNIWNVGQRVQFNAPINELATLYMVRKKAIHRITTIDTIFYTFELVSSFNSETAVNYFDNQRAKANGNIGEGEYISRNIDIQSTANIIFYDTQANEITVVGDNQLNCTLESPFVS